MVYFCIKCYYQTDHVNYMKNHLNKKNKCKMSYLLLLSNENILKLSSISLYNNSSHINSYIEYINYCFENGIESINDFKDLYQKSINIKYDFLEKKRINEKIKKKYHFCYDCGFYFDNKSNVIRHQKLNRCFINNLLDDNHKTENISIFNYLYDLSNINNIKLIFDELDKGYINFIKFKLENQDIKCNLFYIEKLEENYLIILLNNTFKRVNRIEYFENWLKNTIEDFEKIFEDMSTFIEWKTLKNKYNLLMDEFNSFLNNESNKNICFNEWSQKVFENNDKFINYIKLNKHVVESFKIFD